MKKTKSRVAQVLIDITGKPIYKLREEWKMWNLWVLQSKKKFFGPGFVETVVNKLLEEGYPKEAIEKFIDAAFEEIKKREERKLEEERERIKKKLLEYDYR